jgi:hypothetical protein
MYTVIVDIQKLTKNILINPNFRKKGYASTTNPIARRESCVVMERARKKKNAPKNAIKLTIEMSRCFISRDKSEEKKSKYFNALYPKIVPKKIVNSKFSCLGIVNAFTEIKVNAKTAKPICKLVFR